MSSRNRLLFLSAVALSLSVSLAGCRSASSRRTTVVGDEPGLAGLDADDKATLAAAPARETSVVDRHPVLYKPREYWDNSGDNRFVKAAAATFVGVPAGVVGEIRQVFTGVPEGVR